MIIRFLTMWETECFRDAPFPNRVTVMCNMTKVNDNLWQLLLIILQAMNNICSDSSMLGIPPPCNRKPSFTPFIPLIISYHRNHHALWVTSSSGKAHESSLMNKASGTKHKGSGKRVWMQPLVSTSACPYSLYSAMMSNM